MKKKVLLIGIVVAAFVPIGLAWFFYCGPGSDQSHRTNRQYLLWKSGKAAYDPAVALRFIGVDVEFRVSLRGRSEEEVRKWFPDLRSPDDASEYQRCYDQDIKEMSFLWIGDSAWGIEFDRGRVKEFHLWKG